MSLPSRRRAASIVLSLLLSGALLSIGGSRPARADDTSLNDAIAQQQGLEASLADHRAALARLQRDAAALSGSLQRVTAELTSVGLEVDKAGAELQALTAELSASRAELGQYEQQIATLASDLTQVAASIAQSKTDLATRQLLLQAHLRVAYEQSQTSLLEVLLSANSLSDATNELGFMLTLSDQDAQLAGEISRARARLQIRQQTLVDGQTTLAQLRDAAAKRTAVLDGQQRQLAAATQALDAKREQLRKLQDAQQSQLAQTTANAAEQAALIARQTRALEGQRALVEQLKAEARKLDVAFPGRFAWPEKGGFVVTQEFGPTQFSMEPPYTYGGTYYPHFHTGIDLAYLSPRCGGPIFAAADGTVLADGRPNAAYGDSAIGVILGHSQRLQSWYWHLAREVVSVGQHVSAGELIGYEGATGMATGCHLHFQVMFDDQPVDPRTYLP
jgi:murein DD-endopeptidase MepM/ murein hydrolase activator NlpD